MNGEQLQAGCHRNGRKECRIRPSPRVSAIALALSTALAGIGGVTMSQPARAQATSAIPQQQFSIPAGSLRESLDALASQSGITMLYSPGLVVGKTSRGLYGRHTAREALRILLQGSGLEAQDAGDSTFTLRQAPPSEGQLPKATSSSPVTTKSSEPEVRELEKLTVTGTRIRGGVTPSPVFTIGSEQIREEGFADIGEAIRSLPQNFNGGQNPGVVTASLTSVANTNVTGGSSLNLRGLGPDASLTLLNGRRMSYGGYAQAIDISAIPVEAVDRIEIVADGASAIYGSDAVAGVANVILRRDFDGVAVGARYGTATDGGLTTREYTVTAGTVWSSGGLIATYKDSSADPIYADQRAYTEGMFDPRTLHPGSDLGSGLLSAYQWLGDTVELRLDALKTKREQLSYAANAGYYFHDTPETAISLLSPSIGVFLSNDWNLSFGITHGKDETNTNTLMAMGGVAVPFSSDCYCNDLRLYEMGVEGPLFSMSGGDARLAAGAGYRRNGFSQENHLTGERRYGGQESSRFAYAEINLPLAGPASNIVGLQRLEFAVAMRGEDYDTFGSVSTPKLGLIYGPSEDLTLKVSWGKAFKAPSLLQRYQNQLAVLYPAALLGGVGFLPTATAFYVTGGNPDLEPERARSWTASAILHPSALPDLNVELSFFDIDYTNRVALAITNGPQALSNPIYAPFVNFTPTAEHLAEIVETYDVANGSGAPYDPNNVVAIAYGYYMNLARQQVRGIDLTSSYGFDVGNGRLTVRGSVSWLDSSQQASPNQNAYDLAGTIFNPSKFNGRAGAVWNRGNFIGSIFINYTGGVDNNVTPGVVEKTASFTTFDTTLRYSMGSDRGVFSGLEFALSAQNLFDREPPLFTISSINLVPYDSTNYSAIGRFLSASISKRW